MITLEVQIPKYKPEKGIQYNWIGDFEIDVQLDDKEVVLTANKDGLMSLANHLLNLAQDDMPSGNHIHLDEFGGLEEGSLELVIVRK